MTLSLSNQIRSTSNDDELPESATNEIAKISSAGLSEQQEQNTSALTTPHRKAHIGDVVVTPFGEGTVRQYRPQHHVYVIELLSCTNNYSTLLYTKAAFSQKHDVAKTSTISAMQLNDAYEALEQMRRYNLEMECFENGIQQCCCDHEQCTACLLNSNNKNNTMMFGGLQTRLAARTNKTNNNKKKKAFLLRRSATPCLICASPTCSQHASKPFQRERITLCLECEKLFDISFITDCMNMNPNERQDMLDMLMDAYDRCVLLLKYSSQFMDDLICSLERSKLTHNKVHLGSSSAGVVSGVLGVAAAATILTPAGAPLLIASLLFGGSATAVQTSSDAMQYYSEPRRLADRIIALMGVTQSILRVTGVLRDALMRDYIRKDVYVNDKNNNKGIVMESAPPTTESSKEPLAQGVLAASNIGQGISLGGTVTMEAAEMGARSATALSRAGTAAARALRVARIAGGALSAAVLVLEANSMHSTISEIRAGSPCHKAETLRKIQDELDRLPSTASLESECQSYLQALTERPVPVVKKMNETFHTPGTLIIEGVDDTDEADYKVNPGKQLSTSSTSPRSSPRLRSSSDGSGLSLLERIRIYKLREAEDTKHDVNGRVMSGDDLPLHLCT